MEPPLRRRATKQQPNLGLLLWCRESNGPKKTADRFWLGDCASGIGFLLKGEFPRDIRGQLLDWTDFVAATPGNGLDEQTILWREQIEGRLELHRVGRARHRVDTSGRL